MTVGAYFHFTHIEPMSRAITIERKVIVWLTVPLSSTLSLTKAA